MKHVFFSFVLAASLVSAAQLEMLEPVHKFIDNGQTVDLGVVGPGQKIVVIANRPSGELSRNTAGAREALWDKLLVDTLPSGWKSEDSKLYENPFQAFVTVGPETADGDYQFTLKTLNEYDGIPALSVQATLRVSKDVMGFSVKNSKASTGVGQPGVFFLTLKNTGSASDVYELTPSGIPAGWGTKRRLFVPHNSEINVAYEVLPEEHGEYVLNFRAESLSNPRIFKMQTATLKTETSVWNDLKASANGVLLFPTVQQSAYALLSLVAQWLR